VIRADFYILFQTRNNIKRFNVLVSENYKYKLKKYYLKGNLLFEFLTSYSQKNLLKFCIRFSDPGWEEKYLLDLK
jgi:hypothetical protein